ncbi:hypothetical protein ACFY9N_03900 [Microbacterium sp. NPDC008134]|uniref:hypothetical protein n=1 Tax=Microbacterium sp. NPDC008134 TaxID=3364183 RepID=UPI0036E8673C
MATLLIGYDLNKQKNYPDLIEAIKGLGTAWWHHLDSTWLVVTPKSPEQARNVLLTHLDADDELLVIDVTGQARAWYGFNEKGSEWLNSSYE